MPLLESENTSTSAAPSTSATSSALRRSSGGRFSMSHAWLIACRSAPITPLAAAISSSIAIGPSWPVLSSASPTVRSSRARSASWDERHVLEHRLDDAAADLRVFEEQPEAADQQHRQRHERQDGEERDLRRVAMPAVVDELDARAPEREQDPVDDPPCAHLPG